MFFKTVLDGLACLVYHTLNIPSLMLVARMLATKLARMGEMYS